MNNRGAWTGLACLSVIGFGTALASGHARRTQAVRHLLPMVFAVVLSGFTDQQIEAVGAFAHEANEAVWTCLQAEVQKSVSFGMKPDDFALYVKGVCLKETKAFRVSLMDYLAMKHPDTDDSTYIATAESIIRQWRDAAINLQATLNRDRRSLSGEEVAPQNPLP
jgi:hypothetical protein